jgi:MFS family permease
VANKPVSEGNSPPIEEDTGWLNPAVIGMGLTSFFSDLGHETASSILPLFLASLGAPAAALGVIEGVSDALSSFAKLGAGWLGDRVSRRKPIVVGGYMLTGLATGLFGLATSWPQILVSRAVGWFGRGVRGPLRDAMLADAVDPRERGRAFGLERAGDTLGAVLGPATALLLVSAMTYRKIFLLTVIPGLIAALCFAVLVREHGRRLTRPRKFWEALGALPRGFRVYLIAVAVFGAGDFAHTLLILRASQALAPSLGTVQAGALAIGLYTIHNVIYAAATVPAGALGDRYGKRRLLAGGYLLAAVMSGGFILATPSWWHFALLFAAGGLYIAVEDTLERALAADLLPRDMLSTGYGALAAANGLGDFVSSVLVGVLWTVVSPAAGFAYAAILSLVGAALVSRVRLGG